MGKYGAIHSNSTWRFIAFIAGEDSKYLGFVEVILRNFQRNSTTWAIFLGQICLISPCAQLLAEILGESFATSLTIESCIRLGKNGGYKLQKKPPIDTWNWCWKSPKCHIYQAHPSSGIVSCLPWTISIFGRERERERKMKIPMKSLRPMNRKNHSDTTRNELGSHYPICLWTTPEAWITGVKATHEMKTPAVSLYVAVKIQDLGTTLNFSIWLFFWLVTIQWSRFFQHLIQHLRPIEFRGFMNQ